MTKKQSKRKSQKLLNKQKRNKQENLFFRNFISVFVSAILILFLYISFNGYRWVVNGLVINNLKIIFQKSNLSLEQKWKLKCGFDFVYLNYIKKNTPEDAVILMPPLSALYPEKERIKTEFNTKSAAGVKNKAWATYFLYPRKLVYQKEKDSNYLYNKVTHVAIANYWGYDQLNYPTAKKQKYSIMPLNKLGENE